MCGINGIVYYGTNIQTYDLKVQIVKMNDAIKHRGPDSDGVFINENVALGFRRLSIIDLNTSANQPMISADKNHVIVFNGEIYNYVELKSELANLGAVFKTESDTEVLLTAYKYWGKNCVNRFNGMWAFAIYNLQTKEFFLSRDRLGVKPLVYYVDEKMFVFSSESKALLSVIPNRLANLRKTFEYINYGYRTADGDTFFNNFKEILPGNNLSLKNDQLTQSNYWELKTEPKVNEDFDEVVNNIKVLLTDSLKIRFRSDVPIGVLLSGGLDSTILIKLIDNLIDNGLISDTSISTYSAIFPNFEFDESKTIKNIIKTTRHIRPNFIEPNLDYFTDNFNKLVKGFNEPVGSAGSFAHYWLMHNIRKENIKVVINGQGADEVFGGYDKTIIGYFLMDSVFSKNGKFIKELKLFANKRGLSYWFVIAQIIKAILGRNHSSAIRARYFDKTTQLLNKQFVNTYEGKLLEHGMKKLFSKRNLDNHLLNHIRYEGLSQILYSEDMSSMQNSIEMRSPFLDYRIYEYGMRLENQFKISDGFSKYILRKAFESILPNEIVNEKNKIGFVTPFNLWLKDSRFSEMVKDTLNNKSFMNRAIWNPLLIKKEFENIDLSSSSKLWRILNFQIWADEFNISNV